MRSYEQRRLTDFLHREYDVKHVKVEPRTKHLKLIWEWEGKEFSHMVRRSAKGDGGGRSLDNAVAQIRREMGRPAKEERHTMDELTAEVRDRAIDSLREEIQARQAPEPLPEPEQPPARTWSAQVSAYRERNTGSLQVFFYFPRAIITTLPFFTIEQMDPEHWRFRKDNGGHGRPWKTSTASQVRTSVRSSGEPFRVMYVEAVEVDGEVLVYVPLADRVAPISNRPAPKPQQETPGNPIVAYERVLADANKALDRMGAPPAQEPPPPAQPGLNVPDRNELERYLRDLLVGVREVEQKTPYRLTREGNTVVWAAAPIK